MSDHEIFRGADLRSLATLPQLNAADREVLDRLLWLAPDVALATAAAVLRSHQPELHDLLFPRERERNTPEIGRLARALVYLGLAIAAPGQGKLLPLLDKNDARQAQAQARLRFALWNQADLLGSRDALEAEAVPDPELRRVLNTLVERASSATARDPRWLRAMAFSEAGAFYAALSAAGQQQFGAVIDVEAITGHLQRVARTRDLLADALAPDAVARPFNPSRQGQHLERLRRFGWDEHVASRGRTLRDVAAEAATRGFRATSSFALTDEWLTSGASQPTNGRRYFIRPTLLPDSRGLALWAQEERLRPLQKMLAGDPNETGLRLTLGSVELLLEYAVRTGRVDFLEGQWTRASNRFGGLQTRFGGLSDGSYGITIFPGARIDPAVGVCPVIEVTSPNS